VWLHHKIEKNKKKKKPHVCEPLLLFIIILFYFSPGEILKRKCKKSVFMDILIAKN